LRDSERSLHSLTQSVAVEASERAIRTLNCAACHQRGDRTPDWPILLAMEGVQGLAPEFVPDFTWIGEKLKPAWTELLISGQLKDKPRPWLKVTMPVFPTLAHSLSAGLSHEHGFIEDDSVATDVLNPTQPADSRNLGRQLTLNNVGFNCVQCHDVGDQPAVAPFENRGVNFDIVPDRFRYDFYLRWMRDATRINLATRMPRLSPDGRVTEITDVYGGDARSQFDAMWHYIQSLQRKR